MATPNMALETNALGATDWHTDNEANIAKIDAHDHSSGKGVKVPEAGLATAVVGKLVSNGDAHNHSGGDGAQIDHGSLAGLGDDDHTQYLTAARGDSRYAGLGTGVTGGNAHDHAGGDGAVIPTAGIANDAVDDTKVGNRVPQLYRRQGGSPTHWDICGITNYTPGAVRIQCGIFSTAGASSITFPVPFSYTPIILVSVMTETLPDKGNYAKVITASTTGFTAKAYDSAGVPALLPIAWLAIGPE